MGRLRLALAVLCGSVGGACAYAPAAAFEIAPGHEVDIGVEGGFVSVSALPSWTDGAYGKLRSSEDGIAFKRAYADYRGRFLETVSARVALEGYGDDLGNAIGVTEAYIEWRPVPRSAMRYRLKAGAFYPRISLENVDPGWSSRYTLNTSAINSWVAEELRSTGFEFSASRRLAGGTHTLAAHVAAFTGNDPAGSLLAWKGWSVHDRQSRFGDDLPLAPLPQIQPGGLFWRQDPYVEPFEEIDSNVGYYVNAEWRIGSRVLLRAMHYDNQGDPTALEQGQYAWETVFEHVAMQASLPAGVGLLAQWMSGSTVMGGRVGEWHMVDTEFASGYVMLTRTFDRHRVSLRRDHFAVRQLDEVPADSNQEDGRAWTLGYQYRVTDAATVAFEWLSIRTERMAWMYYGAATRATERQTQLVFRLRF